MTNLRVDMLLRVDGNAVVADRERRSASEGLCSGLDGLQNLRCRKSAKSVRACEHFSRETYLRGLHTLVLLEVLCGGRENQYLVHGMLQ